MNHRRWDLAGVAVSEDSSRWSFFWPTMLHNVSPNCFHLFLMMACA